MDHRSATFADSTHSNHDIFIKQSLLLSVTPVLCMNTANFINVEVRVCYSFSKHNIFSAKAKESFVVVWIIEEIHLEIDNAFLRLDFRNSLTFTSYTKTLQNGAGEVAGVSYCYYSRDSREIVRKFPCTEVVKFTDGDWMFWDVLPAAPCGRFQTLRPAKGECGSRQSCLNRSVPGVQQRMNVAADRVVLTDLSQVYSKGWMWQQTELS